MRFHTHRKKTILSLLCMICCISFAGCAEQTSSDDSSFELDFSSIKNVISKVTSTVTKSKNCDIFIPEEITMEFFGIDLLKINRPIWEMHIFSLNELPETGYYDGTYPIGDYTVNHSYLNFENTGNFSSTIDYHDNNRCSQILFDKNNKLTKIDVISDMGEEFHTSFLNIGDNVKDYFESSKPGLWEKFLNGEKITAENGWYVRHSTVAYPDYTLDSLQVSNSNLAISYFIRDDLVDYIMLSVVGELTLDEDLASVMSIYHLDSFNFYINGADIATMSCREWMELFNFSQYDTQALECKYLWKDLLDFSEEHFKNNSSPGSPETGYSCNCYTTLNGTKIFTSFNYHEDTEWKSIYLTLHPEDFTNPTDPSVAYDTSYGMIIFEMSRDGYFNIIFYIENACPEITSDQLMPGDNIKTFLNSYEDGLYEKLMSLSDELEEYNVGPYTFQYHREPNCITVKKHDERSISPVSIFFENEIATAIERSYCGMITDFEEEPFVW